MDPFQAPIDSIGRSLQTPFMEGSNPDGGILGNYLMQNPDFAKRLRGMIPPQNRPGGGSRETQGPMSQHVQQAKQQFQPTVQAPVAAQVAPQQATPPMYPQAQIVQPQAQSQGPYAAPVGMPSRADMLTGQQPAHPADPYAADDRIGRYNAQLGLGQNDVRLIKGDQDFVVHDGQEQSLGDFQQRQATEGLTAGMTPEQQIYAHHMIQAGMQPKDVATYVHQQQQMAAKGAGGGRPQSFNEASEQDRNTLADLEHQHAALQKLGDLSPEQQTSDNQLMPQIADLRGKLSSPNYLENAAAGQRNQSARGEVQDAEQHVIPMNPRPVQQTQPQQKPSLDHELGRAQQMGIPQAPKGGAKVSLQLAHQFLDAAGNDQKKAKAIAQTYGYSF